MTATQTTPTRKPRPEFPWHHLRVVDGLTVKVVASMRVRFGRSEDPGVTITVYDPEPQLSYQYTIETDCVLVSETMRAPGREVYERETINQMGRPGAVVFHWLEDWRGAWLDREIARMIARAQRALETRPPSPYGPRMLRAISATAWRVRYPSRREGSQAPPAWEDMQRAIQRVQSGAPESEDDELTTMLRQELDRSRVDGSLIDREATLAIRRITRTRGQWIEYRLACRLRTTPAIATELRDSWGGSVSQETTPTGAPRSTTLWQITGKPLAWMLETMLPYLERQRDMAALILEMRQIMDARPAGGQRPEDIAAQLEEIYQRSLALRAGGEDA